MTTTHDSHGQGEREETRQESGMPCPLCALTRALQLERLIGAEAADHLRRSQKEVLLAVRSAINSALDNLESKTEPPKAERINIE